MNSRERIGYKRLLLGLLIAPAFFPIYLCVIPCFDFYVIRGEALILHVAIAAAIAYAVSVIFGLPYSLLMQRRGWLNYGTIIVPTLALTATVMILERALPYETLNYAVMAMSTAPGVLLAGICFYLLAVWQREPHIEWTILLSITFIWLLYFAGVAIQRHNFATSNPMSDTGSALGLMIVMKGGRILSLVATVLLACVWLVFAFWRPSRSQTA